MADPLAIVTPWYPTAQRPFHGSFVRGFVDAVRETTHRPVHVYHLEAWGLPRGKTAARRVRRDLASLLTRAGRGVPLLGDDVSTIHIPAPVVPGSSFGRIAHDHHEFLAGIWGGELDETLVHAHVGLGGGWPAVAMMRPDANLFVTEHATFLARLLEEEDARARYDEVIARSTGFFCVSEVLRAHLLEFFPHRAAEVQVLPNPIRFTAIPPRRDPVDARLRRWLYVGYLTERKGVLPLLEAFAIANDKHGDLHLSMVGEGPLAQRLLERASELGVSNRVTLTGPVPPDQVINAYQAHDLLVHLSDYETFGMTIVEAVAVGIPVIVTRCGGPEETIGPIVDRVGRLVSVDRDPEEVALAYDDLRASDGPLDLAGGRASLEARYSFEAVGSELGRRYEQGAVR